MEVTFTVDKDSVLEEVAQKSAYMAAKKDYISGNDAAGAEVVANREMDRVPTIDEDADELGQFFNECRVQLAFEFASILSSEGMSDYDSTYTLVLNMPSTYNTALNTPVQTMLFDFFVYGLLARWCIFIENADLAAAFASQSIEYLDKVKSQARARIFTRGLRPF